VYTPLRENKKAGGAPNLWQSNQLNKATLYVHDVAHEALRLPQHDAPQAYDAHARCGHDARLFHEDQLYGALQLAYGDELPSHDALLPSHDALLLLLTFYFLLNRFYL
jgi:hypothetical protein